jgi:cellulose synthase/poly-beta-1,6-N-acetylglucosamine synthase-like glycosyltransferase
MIIIGLLLSLMLIGYSFAGYPLLMGLLARCFPKPWKQGVEAEKGLSIVLCVHNAEAIIRERLQNLLDCTWEGPLEIIVVCDGCTDGTVKAIQDFAAPQVRVLETGTKSGKPAGLNLALAQCSHDIVVLADVRQSFAKDALQKLAAPFAESEVGAVSGLLEIATSAAGGGRGVDLYWKLETKLRAFEGRFDSVIGCTGAICAIRRDLFEPLPADTLLDDVVIPMRIAHRGHRVIYEPAAKAFDPQQLEPEKEKKRKLRTLVGNFQMMERYPAWMLPWRNRLWWMLISHKYLRLLVPWLMIAAFVLSVMGASQPFVRVVLILQLLCYAAGLLGSVVKGIPSRFVSIPAGFLLLQASCFMAFFAYVRYRRDLLALWQPSTTSTQ